MKKLILSLILGLSLFVTKTNAQSLPIAVTTWDTASFQPAVVGQINGFYIKLSFNDPSTAVSWLVRFAATPYGNGDFWSGQMQYTKTNVVLNAFNVRMFGWACDWTTQTYRKNGILNITGYDQFGQTVSSFEGWMPCPSNYLANGCGVASTLNFNEPSPGTVFIGGGPGTMVGSITLSYSINGGTTYTYDSLLCPYIAVTNVSNGSSISATYTLDCPDTTTTKTQSYTVLGTGSIGVTPQSVLNPTATSGTITTVSYTPANTLTSQYEIVPIYIQGGKETRVLGRAQLVSTPATSATFNNLSLKQTVGASGTAKFKFGITTINGSQRSTEVYTNQVSVR